MRTLVGAGDGNRTRVSGLGSERSAIELHLQVFCCQHSIPHLFHICKKKDCFFYNLWYTEPAVRETGAIPVRARRREVRYLFFLLAPWSQKGDRSLELQGSEKAKKKALQSKYLTVETLIQVIASADEKGEF